MKKGNKGSNHLIRNLVRIYPENSVFNYKAGRKAFSPLGEGNISKWLETFLPNTRIILEPKIIGSGIGIQYIKGRINKAVNENSQNITEMAKSLKNIPNCIPIKDRIEIRGVLYDDKNISSKNNENLFIGIQNFEPQLKRLRFCAFQIFHCNINHFQSLQELKKLKFEIPQTEFTNFI